MRRPFFAVLGGMGSLATESYVRLVNEGMHATCDQDYLDYVVFNDAGVPDRTAFITGQSDDDPFPVIADDIAKATAIGASFIVLTCNTAHYFYDHFQSLTPVPILHMPRGAIARISLLYPASTHPRLGFLGTVGSRASGVYRQAAEEAGYTFVEPDDALQERITSLIYDDVKGDRGPDLNRYRSVLDDMLDPAGECRADVLVLGCTELSVLNERFPMPRLAIVDAQAVLVEDTIERAKALRTS
ncbi:aspartate/glutamate racemase family protein [Bifidobacterium sp. CP2]|uniref:aspartate/glutamate racemase family protein n=1 Tax=Bifidobacterium sp. CP2 TaxID=2809025 RepID=UPI001BDCDAD8|nr:amino acid racemase [Bifidobacterium sp. CP2]MBT1182081.1 aspartate/glutamate racemase family protein [Bifidobacterium sp. CP2]